MTLSAVKQLGHREGNSTVSGRRRGPVGAPLEDADLGTKDPGAGPHTVKSRRQGLRH